MLDAMSETADAQRPLPGDDLLPVDAACVTRSITIAAPPERIWPWLVQMGRDRAGWYSHDALDGNGRASATALVPDLQHVEAGDVWSIAGLDGGLTVLRVEPGRSLVLGGGRDLSRGTPLDFFGPMPDRYWRASWAFVLIPIEPGRTRLVARARVDYAPLSTGLRMLWMRPLHSFMQSAQLRNLARRAEGALPHHHDTAADVLDGLRGAARMGIAFLTPFLRARRSRWGVTRTIAARRYPGDDFIAVPRWAWTHGVEIDAPPSVVWPWLAQLGRDKGGFYSYQWLENLAGCDVQNADRIVEAWQHPREGDRLQLHPSAPGLPIVSVQPGRWMLATADGDPIASSAPTDRWVRASWLFWIEPLDDGRRSRLISRYRLASSDDFATRAKFGAGLVEPIGTAMDRRMLLGIKYRAEHDPQREAPQTRD